MRDADSDSIQEHAVNSRDIAVGTITNQRIAANAVDTDSIKSRAVTREQLLQPANTGRRPDSPTSPHPQAGLLARFVPRLRSWLQGLQ